MNFIVCGAQNYIPPTVSPLDPYISPLRHPFQSKTPIWIQSGRLETLYEDSFQFAKEMKATEGG
jgi:acetyl esterase/lipase